MTIINRSNLKSVISEETKKVYDFWKHQSKKYPKQADLYEFYYKLDSIEIKYMNTFRADCDGMDPEEVKHLALEDMNKLTVEFIDRGLSDKYSHDWDIVLRKAYKKLEAEEANAAEGSCSNKAFTIDTISF